MSETNGFRVLWPLAAMTLIGCLGAPPVVEGEASEALGSAFANDKPAFDFFVAKGLTNFQSAGIVGNLDQESGVNPGSVQYGGGPGRGIAQWSVGGRWDSSANDNVLAYAAKLGQPSGSLNLQLEFIWYELTTFGYGFSQLKATTNVTDATVVFMDKYEICGTCVQTQRVSYAQSVLQAYGATPPWGASFVSQTWPYASMPAFTVKCGESVAAKIVLKNDGAKAWDASTRLGTTQPRDRASIFAGNDWISPNRAAEIKGSVAPGADGTFTFSFHGPTGAACVPGTYHEFFGVVQESVAWFSDSGQGGPPDNQLEALIEVVPGDPTPPPDLAGGNPPAGDDGGVGGGTGSGPGGGTGSGGTTGGGDTGATPPPSNPGAPAGCSVASGASGGAGGLGVMLLLLLAGAGRRRARLPHRPEAARAGGT
jgi:MYXO-CTERM domain-containing protein